MRECSSPLGARVEGAYARAHSLSLPHPKGWFWCVAAARQLSRTAPCVYIREPWPAAPQSIQDRPRYGVVVNRRVVVSRLCGARVTSVRRLHVPYNSYIQCTLPSAVPRVRFINWNITVYRSEKYWLNFNHHAVADVWHSADDRLRKSSSSSPTAIVLIRFRLHLRHAFVMSDNCRKPRRTGRHGQTVITATVTIFALVFISLPGKIFEKNKTKMVV